MFDSLKGIVAAVKEGAVEAGAKAYLNRRFQHLGTVTKLQIDARSKCIVLEAALKGEAAPVTVKVLNYELISAAEANYLVLGRFEASRQWLTAVLNDFVAGQRLQIPAGLSKIL